jgi:ADP-heptose:LPS heptosyltransferase
VPSKTSYLTGSDKRTIEWQSSLPTSKYKRVGFVFSGSKKYYSDPRSIPVQDFARLLDLSFSFHCLQKDIDTADELYLKQYANVHLHKDSLHTFLDTASLIECMDITITVDTAVAHLCGALGRPFLLLLPYNCDPRWLLERSDPNGTSCSPF